MASYQQVPRSYFASPPPILENFNPSSGRYASEQDVWPSLQTSPVPVSSTPPPQPPLPVTQWAAIPLSAVHSKALSPNSDQTQISVNAIPSKRTCSLHLLCYRSGGRGCKRAYIRVTKKEFYAGVLEYEEDIKNSQDLITRDENFFKGLRRIYRSEMCGFWRRLLGLKTLRRIQLLTYTSTTRPTVVDMDSSALQEILYAYRNPSKVTTETQWIDWVYTLRQPDHRHALEFVETWSGFRIAMLGSIPLLTSTLVGVIWSIRSGDVQAAFTVAAFILALGTAILALLAIISKIES